MLGHLCFSSGFELCPECCDTWDVVTLDSLTVPGCLHWRWRPAQLDSDVLFYVACSSHTHSSIWFLSAFRQVALRLWHTHSSHSQPEIWGEFTKRTCNWPFTPSCWASALFWPPWPPWALPSGFPSPGRLHLLSGLQVAHTAPAPNSPPEPACLVHTVTLPSLSFWFGVGIVVFQSPQLSHEEEEELGAYFILPPPIF